MHRLSWIVVMIALCAGAMALVAQTTPWSDTVSTYIIERHNGSILQGRIVAMDARELAITLPDGTRLTLPKHLVRTIRARDVQSASALTQEGEVSTSTYVVTSSALPSTKGASTLQFNLAGVALEAFPTERFSVGLLASWFSAPIIATAMVRTPIADNVWLGVGGFVGWGGSLADRNVLAAPTLTLSAQSGSTNVSLTGGYGVTSLEVETFDRPDYAGSVRTDQITTQRAYAALGLSFKLARKVRLVLDAFMITGSGSVLLPDGRWMRSDDVYNYYDPTTDFTRSFETYSNIFIIPAIRWEYSADAYWQFGFAGYKGNLLNLDDNSDWSPLPIPVVQWVISL